MQIYRKTLLSIGYGLSHHIQLYRFCTQNSVGNFHEQVIPFLVSLYLHATFVSVKGACTCGWAWIFFRSYYGYVYKKGVPILFLSTIPAYCCVWYMIGGTIYGVSTMDWELCHWKVLLLISVFGGQELFRCMMHLWTVNLRIRTLTMASCAKCHGCYPDSLVSLSYIWLFNVPYCKKE